MSPKVQHSQIEGRSSDGTTLVMQSWAVEKPLAQVLVLHGYAEHAERYREFAHHMAEHQWNTLALDFRGHGRSSGKRGAVRRFEEYHEDGRAALRQAKLSGLKVFMLGHSNGGLIALDWLSQDAESCQDVEALILSNPFLDVAMHVPAWKRAIGNLTGKLVPTLGLPSGIPATALSGDPQQVQAYEQDPMVFSHATGGYFLASREAQARVKELRSFPLPLLYLIGDDDGVASASANKVLAEHLKERAEIYVEKGARHELLNETCRRDIGERIADYIQVAIRG